MRDILIIAIVLAGALVALRRPWIGVLLWVWLSLMNPHRYSWGIAYEAPLAAIAAAATIIGLVFTRERRSPFKSSAVGWLAVFTVWITISWLMGLDPSGDMVNWLRVIKINLMIFVTLILLHSKKHIFALAWVATGSLALLGAKGGLFTVLTGGDYHVWGPPGSFIQDNNAFALALVMTIPLVRFLQLQLTGVWPRRWMFVVMILLAAAALGSQSRGGLLAICAMAALLWWRSGNRLQTGVVVALLTIALVAFMPVAWSERMSTIESYDVDLSAQGRFSAWNVAWGAAFDHLFGVGFNAARPELFARYSPHIEIGTPVAHSIYFEVLGHHGFIGLFLFIGMWAATWLAASKVRKQSKELPETKWCRDLASMAQVSLIGYLVGGAFLSLAYYDFPYYVLALVMLTQAWLQRRAWETEPKYAPGWKTIPGLADAAPGRQTRGRQIHPQAH